MWGSIISALGTVFGGWVDLHKTKIEAQKAMIMQQATSEADWDQEALRQAEYSWKDEFITLIWFAPLIVAWFNTERSQQWVDFVQQLPFWYQVGMFGIIAASFGLRWFFKQSGFNLAASKSAS